MFISEAHQSHRMEPRKSEYQIQAMVNQGLNQLHGLDSPEGAVALLQANKPEVDGTEIEKQRIFARIDTVQVKSQIKTMDQSQKLVSQTNSPHPTRTNHTLKRT